MSLWTEEMIFQNIWRCLTSLPTREMQMKAALTFLLTLVRKQMAVSAYGDPEKAVL